MENKNKNKNIFKIIKFDASYKAPSNKYNVANNFIEWGDKNAYPQYLLDIYNYNGSSTHKSIINKKVKLISGKGFSDVADVNLNNFIVKNKLNSEVKKASLDYEIFNAFAIEVIWSKDKTSIVSLKHIPFHKLRIGIKNDLVNYNHLWFSNDWGQFKKYLYKPELIREFNPNIKEGKQIYYYTEYNPSSDGIYPIIGYSTSMNWIEMDYETSKFHLNQVKQGYSPSFILNFATGIPEGEEQDEFYRDFKKNYAGSENSGKIILTYSEGAEGKPELIPIQLNDSDERFIMLMEQIENNIVRGHEIPPQLVIQTPGKLGSSSEREELLNEFQQSYVTPRQEVIEGVLNEILSTSGYKEKITLRKYVETDTPIANDKEAEARATLKGSVGGVQGIIQIQQSVAAGLTDRGSAQAMLELIYGFSPEDSIRLLGDVKEGDNLNEI